MSALRRLEDAICAFVHGHARRDLRRVRARRAVLLAGRLMARRQKRYEATLARHRACPGYFRDDHLEWTRSELQTAVDLVDSALKRPTRAVRAVLVDELMIDRFCAIDADYVGRDPEVDLLPGKRDGFADELRAVLRCSHRGKLYEGLFEHSPLHAFQHKLRACVQHFGSFLLSSAGSIAEPFSVRGVRRYIPQDADRVSAAGLDGSDPRRTPEVASGPAFSSEAAA